MVGSTGGPALAVVPGCVVRSSGGGAFCGGGACGGGAGGGPDPSLDEDGLGSGAGVGAAGRGGSGGGLFCSGGACGGGTGGGPEPSLDEADGLGSGSTCEAAMLGFVGGAGDGVAGRGAAAAFASVDGFFFFFFISAIAAMTRFTSFMLESARQ